MALGLTATVFSGCQTTGAADGAVIGTALGAGLGAIVGHQSGHQGEGALIGAAAGALSGAIIGDQVDKSRQRPVYQQAPQPVAAPAPRAQRGHYETRLVQSSNGEYYEERVWVPHR
jgi:uncharacterized membrane protein YebE (DUF533 family)